MLPNHRVPMLRHYGFTLIELLVVISIIALLVGILLPALGMARVRGHQITSANNMRQIGLSIHMYQNDHDEWFPRTTHGSPDVSTSWIYTLAPYLSDAKQVQHPTDPSKTIWEIGPVRICPRDPKADDRFEHSGTSYILNEWIAVPHFKPFGGIDWASSYNMRSRINKPTETYVMFVGANRLSASIFADHTHSRTWNDWPSVTYDISTDRYGANGSPDFLNGSSNYLFADNHVEEIQAKELKALIDAGTNFSRVPE